jgi:hypothetical protein
MGKTQGYGANQELHSDLTWWRIGSTIAPFLLNLSPLRVSSQPPACASSFKFEVLLASKAK